MRTKSGSVKNYRKKQSGIRIWSCGCYAPIASGAREIIKPKISTWNNCRSLASAETTFRVWPITGKQLCTINHHTGNWPGFGSYFVWKVWHHAMEGGESEISNQRNSLKTKRGKHYLGALGLLLSWIQHHNPITSRFLWAPLIPAQEIDFHSGQRQTSPSPLPHHGVVWTMWQSSPTHAVPEAAQVIASKCCQGSWTANNESWRGKWRAWTSPRWKGAAATPARERETGEAL